MVPQKMRSATRRPLQPKNTFLPSVTSERLKPKELQCAPDKAGKENYPFPSLAEELSAFRKKLERLRVDRERTEEMLKERDRVLDSQTEEILHRGEIQKMLEIEVDRLFRLKELHSYSTKISPIRSLREREREKRSGAEVAISPVPMNYTMEESEEDNTVQSPSSIQSQELSTGTNI